MLCFHCIALDDDPEGLFLYQALLPFLECELMEFMLIGFRIVIFMLGYSEDRVRGV